MTEQRTDGDGADFDDGVNGRRVQVDQAAAGRDQAARTMLPLRTLLL